MSADYIRAVPTIDLPDDELAAVTAAIRRAIEDDRYPHAPRLDPLRAALARLEAASTKPSSSSNLEPDPTPDPKAPPAAKADKRARSAKGAPRRRSRPESSWAGCRPTADRRRDLGAAITARGPVLPEAFDPLGQRLQTPAERRVHRRLVSAHCVSLATTPLVRGRSRRGRRASLPQRQEKQPMSTPPSSLFRPG